MGRRGQRQCVADREEHDIIAPSRRKNSGAHVGLAPFACKIKRWLDQQLACVSGRLPERKPHAVGPPPGSDWGLARGLSGPSSSELRAWNAFGSPSFASLVRSPHKGQGTTHVALALRLGHRARGAPSPSQPAPPRRSASPVPTPTPLHHTPSDRDPKHSPVSPLSREQFFPVKAAKMVNKVCTPSQHAPSFSEALASRALFSPHLSRQSLLTISPPLSSHLRSAPRRRVLLASMACGMARRCVSR